MIGRPQRTEKGPKGHQTTLAVHQLGSGSGGNLTALVGPRGALLVDVGFPAREVLRRLEEAGIARDQVQALVLTHAHRDHARGAPVLARRLRVPIWGTAWTLENLGGLQGREELQALPPAGPVRIDGLLVETCPASHDVPGTVLLKVEGRLGIATDLGEVESRTLSFLSGLEGLLLEFNHDPGLLRQGPYPEWLKERILSDRGHLANHQAAALLQAHGFVPPTRALWLCHLSQQNNRPDLALAAARAALGPPEPEIHLATQEGVGVPVVLPGLS